MVLRMGWSPPGLEIELNRDGDFITRLRSKLGNWPAGTTAAIRWIIPGPAADIVWPATVVGDELRWHVAKADVAEVLDAEPEVAKLDYANDDAEIVWFRGAFYDHT